MSRILTVLLLLSTQAFAHEKNDSYGGVSAGSAFNDSDELAVKLYLGHRVLPFVGFEISATNFGEVVTGDTVVRTSGINPQLAGYIPLGGLQLFGKVGAMFWESDTRVNNHEVSDDSGSGISAGIGFAIFFDDHFFIRGEVEAFEFAADTDAEVLTTFGMGFAI